MIDEHTPEWFRDKLDVIHDAIKDFIESHPVSFSILEPETSELVMETILDNLTISDASDDDDLSVGYAHLVASDVWQLPMIADLWNQWKPHFGEIANYQDETITFGETHAGCVPHVNFDDPYSTGERGYILMIPFELG